MLRKILNSCSNTGTVNTEEEEEKKEEEEDEKENTVLNFLLCGRIDDAFRTALKSGHLRLATIVTQAGGDERMRDLLRKQIEIWRSQRCDTFIDDDVLKSYSLLAGERNTDLPSTWKQALLLEFLYYHPPNSTIVDVVSEYSRHDDLPKPVPRYAERSPETYGDFGNLFRSTEWNLLRFYCERGQVKSLTQSLQSRSHTPIFLQHMLSWHLLRTLLPLFSSIGCDVSELTIPFAHVHRDFSSELEARGMWEWAVFVSLHFKDSKAREIAVKEIISRHTPRLIESRIPSNETNPYRAFFDQDFNRKLEFLRQVLSIPEHWIAEATVWRSESQGHIRALQTFLPFVGDWRKMHNITIEHFMGHFIVSSPKSDFRSLFNLLAPQQDKMEMKARTLWDREGGAVLSLFKLKAEFASSTLSREDFWARHEVEFRRVASCLRSWWNRRAKTREESESKQLESERSRLCNQVLSLSLLSTSFAEMYRDSTCSEFDDELVRLLESGVVMPQYSRDMLTSMHEKFMESVK